MLKNIVLLISSCGIIFSNGMLSGIINTGISAIGDIQIERGRGVIFDSNNNKFSWKTKGKRKGFKWVHITDCRDHQTGKVEYAKNKGSNHGKKDCLKKLLLNNGKGEVLEDLKTKYKWLQ